MGHHFTGVILAAGEGRRMGGLGAVWAKACLPVCNRPLVHHHLDLLQAMGVREIVIVVGYRGNEVMTTASEHGGVQAGELTLTRVEQPERRGIAHALRCARRAIPSHMVVVLGDTYFVPEALERPIAMLSDEGGRLGAVLTIRREVDPKQICRECTVRFDEDGHLIRIQEKPDTPWNDLKPCGMYFFGPRIWDAINQTPPSALRDEVEITDAIQTLVDLGIPVGRAPTVSRDVNINVPGDLLAANLLELSRRGEDFHLHATSVVEPGAVLDQVVVGPNAHIGPGVCLNRALVLPGTSLQRPVDHPEDVAIYGTLFQPPPPGQP
ncbi:MAG: NTP transferase domain-containing protein [Myxococcota bacterium]|jgi:glucose-1-phosphate thymidylyltransferase|nr:NTP transferase domain-containing protein [Myxococcota bacterium]